MALFLSWPSRVLWLLHVVYTPLQLAPPTCYVKGAERRDQKRWFAVCFTSLALCQCRRVQVEQIRRNRVSLSGLQSCRLRTLNATGRLWWGGCLFLLPLVNITVAITMEKIAFKNYRYIANVHCGLRCQCLNWSQTHTYVYVLPYLI